MGRREFLARSGTSRAAEQHVYPLSSVRGRSSLNKHGRCTLATMSTRLSRPSKIAESFPVELSCALEAWSMMSRSMEYLNLSCVCRIPKAQPRSSPLPRRSPHVRSQKQAGQRRRRSCLECIFLSSRMSTEERSVHPDFETSNVVCQNG